MNTIRVGKLTLGRKNAPLFVIAGPCVIENETMVMKTADALAGICNDLGLPLIFKASYDKANRTARDSFRGPGVNRGLAILAKVKRRLGLPILTDVHEIDHCRIAAEVADVLQIPAFPMESEADNVRKVVLQDSDYPALRDSFDDPAVRLLFIVSSHTGIRASELKRIKWDQVDFAKGIIVLERGKTKNKDPRGAPIYGDMGPYLQEAKKQRDEFLR